MLNGVFGSLVLGSASGLTSARFYSVNAQNLKHHPFLAADGK